MFSELHIESILTEQIYFSFDRDTCLLNIGLLHCNSHSIISIIFTQILDLTIAVGCFLKLLIFHKMILKILDSHSLVSSRTSIHRMG